MRSVRNKGWFYNIVQIPDIIYTSLHTTTTFTTSSNPRLGEKDSA